MNKRTKKIQAAGQVKFIHQSIKAKIKDIAVRNIFLSCLLIVLTGFLIYSNTFHVPFLFDDENSVYRNIFIRDSGYFAGTSFADIFSAPRIIGQLTFALNYAVGGLNVVGYHVVNLLIHLGCALLVYWFCLLTFKTPYFSGSFPETGSYFNTPRVVALFTALLFVSHPIQTQAVTYIVQRYASLATFFYLLSVVLYIKFRLLQPSGISLAFYVLSVICAVLAMKTKEIAFTLPVMVIIYEFLFFRGEIKRRMIYLIPLVLTMLIIPLSLIIRTQGGSSAEVGGITDELTRGASLNIISAGDYLITQFRVIVTYIRLLFLPINQNLDYDYPIYRTFFTPAVFFSFVFLLLIFAGGVYLLYRSSLKPDSRVHNTRGKIKSGDKGEQKSWYRLIAFGIFWFFVTISVESSIIPIADVINEHRLYLPSAGSFLVIIGSVLWIRGMVRNQLIMDRIILVILVLIVISFSCAAYARNMIWQDEVKFWEDVVKKSPNKARPHNNLGKLLQERGRINDAQIEYQTALMISPYYVDAHVNLGTLYEDRKLFNEALREYQNAVRINRQSPEAYYNLGSVYAKLNKEEDAINNYQRAIKIKPHYAEAHYNLGNAYYKKRLYNEAAQEYQLAIKYKANYFEPMNNLGNVYIDQNRLDDAVHIFKLALKIKNNSAEVYYNLGNAYLHRQGYKDAAFAFQKALELNPADADARQNLENINKILKTREKK